MILRALNLTRLIGLILGLFSCTGLLKDDPSQSFKNRKEVAISLFLCLEENAPESFIEILDAYLYRNKLEISFDIRKYPYL